MISAAIQKWVLRAALVLVLLAILTLVLMQYLSSTSGDFLYRTGRFMPAGHILLTFTQINMTGDGGNIVLIRTDSSVIERWVSTVPPFSSTWTRGSLSGDARGFLQLDADFIACDTSPNSNDLFYTKIVDFTGDRDDALRSLKGFISREVIWSLRDDHSSGDCNGSLLAVDPTTNCVLLYSWNT